ncbi:MAG: hypothetical protein IPO21_09970 [Bacteroidales bacterium]|nr:hypothetical protein [Bacteroidales bacterium]
MGCNREVLSEAKPKRAWFAEVLPYNATDENQQTIDIKKNGQKNGCKQMLIYIRNAVEKHIKISRILMLNKWLLVIVILVLS